MGAGEHDGVDVGVLVNLVDQLPSSAASAGLKSACSPPSMRTTRVVPCSSSFSPFAR